jgi:tRNA dimethylallyltransferase
MNMGILPPPLALIAGPTASGKSALALALARRIGGVVINADSAQVYRDLSIISARPDLRSDPDVPHLLYGYRDGALPFSAADWARDAIAAIDEAHGRGKIPILVGGTGLYLQTLLDGIAPIPDIDPEIRAAVRAMPVDQSFEALAAADPEAAQRLRPTDKTRLARALEVVRSTGRPLAHWQKERVGGIGGSVSLRPIILLPPRTWLYERCDHRFETMMGADGLAEVERLLSRGLNPLLPVMRAIGVREIAAFIAGECTGEQACSAGKTATRRYAKRQYTWFAHQPPADWPRFTAPLDGPGQTDDAMRSLAAG